MRTFKPISTNIVARPASTETPSSPYSITIETAIWNHADQSRFWK